MGLIKFNTILSLLGIIYYQYQNIITMKSRSIDQFQIVSRLGQGAFGQVFKVKRKQDGAVYALKRIKTTSMKQKDRINALNQIRILASMAGDHIIGYKDSFYDEASTDLCIVLQFAGQGDITRLIKQHSKKKKFIEQNQIWKALVHIAKGIRQLHDNNVLHRDLKSANIFITEDGVYKLGDLNISKVLSKGLARTQTGTPYYCSPQVWKDTPYGPKSDIWSFGCVLYQMAAQKPPFTASDIQGLYKKICAGVFSRIPSIYSNQLSEVINSMLNLNADQRPSTHDLLKNPIVKKNYAGQTFEQINKSSLLQTIAFDGKEWKQINSNLPKSQYEISIQKQEETKNVQTQQNDNLQLRGSQLKVPNKIRVNRPLSSKSDKKYIKESQEDLMKNHSQVQRQPSIKGKRQMILSAGKRDMLIVTPEKKRLNRNLVLPPLSSKRERRGSQNMEGAVLPPKPHELKKDASRGSIEGKNKISTSQQKANYRINVVGSVQKKAPLPNRYY